MEIFFQSLIYIFYIIEMTQICIYLSKFQYLCGDKIRVYLMAVLLDQIEKNFLKIISRENYSVFDKKIFFIFAHYIIVTIISSGLTDK